MWTVHVSARPIARSRVTRSKDTHRFVTSGHYQTPQSGFWGAPERTVLSFLNMKSFGLRGSNRLLGKARRDLLAHRAPRHSIVSIKMATRAEHARYPTAGTGLGVPGPASGEILGLPSLKAPRDCQEVRKEGETKTIKKSRFYREVMKPRANTQKEMCQSQKWSVASSSEPPVKKKRNVLRCPSWLLASPSLSTELSATSLVSKLLLQLKHESLSSLHPRTALSTSQNVSQ